MLKEKLKLFVHRLSWLIIVLLIIVVPLGVVKSQPKLEVVDHNCYMHNYYSSLNETDMEIEITFNRKVYSGYATINYYDELHNLLGTEKTLFYGFNTKTVESSYIFVKGNVYSCEIVSYEIEPSNIDYYGWYGLLLFAVPMLIGALLLSYKRYEYNGNNLSIYAGWYHHTLRVNGELCDEHNTLFTFVPICLSTTLEDGTVLDATITLTNKISLKANNKLLKNNKK